MPDLNKVKQLNRKLARAINEEALRNPRSPYAHKFVGIVDGQVAVIADDLEEMVRHLRKVEPDPRRCFGVEASRDSSQVEYI